ncbi:MAG: hypothetical protein JXA95_07890 [Spirochaetales bacterium]|nr:hypothetical protein [Spirochaetales bacterium]
MKSEMTLKNGMTCTIREAETGDGAAITLYSKLGFMEEGRYYDSVQMGICLD